MAAKISFPPKATDFIDFGKDGGIFVFFSTERFLVREIKRTAVAAAEANGAGIARYDAGEPGHVREAVGSSREIGFFGGRKLVILDYAEEVFEKKNDKALKLVEAALAAPEEANLFLLLFNAMDKRTKFAKELVKNKKIFRELPPPERGDLTAFITTQFGAVKPDQKLVAHFLQKEQSDLFYIESEVTKLRLMADNAGKEGLTLTEARELLSSFGEEKIFKIMDHLVRGDKIRAVTLYRELVRNEGEIKIHAVLIALFIKHFRVVFEGRVLQNRKRDREIPALLQNNNAFYLTRAYQEVFARYKNRTVVTALRDATRLELAMKGFYEIALTDVGASIEQFMLKYF